VKGCISSTRSFLSLVLYVHEANQMYTPKRRIIVAVLCFALTSFNHPSVDWESCVGAQQLVKTELWWQQIPFLLSTIVDCPLEHKLKHCMCVTMATKSIEIMLFLNNHFPNGSLTNYTLSLGENELSFSFFPGTWLDRWKHNQKCSTAALNYHPGSQSLLINTPA